jgi:hypothetical protein
MFFPTYPMHSAHGIAFAIHGSKDLAANRAAQELTRHRTMC